MQRLCPAPGKEEVTELKMPFEAFADFLFRNKFVILFYLLIVLLVFLNRRKFQFHFKVVALYRTNWGIALMDWLALRFRVLIKILGFLGIITAFAGMLFIVFVLFQSLYVLFTKPDAPPALAPIIPGVHVPGVPEGLFIPLVQGLIAIFIVAVIHEFAHGVVARAYNITVKKTGLAIIGPFFAAFVEPDESQLKKRGVGGYSVIAAGAASNIFLFFIILLVMSFAVAPAVNSVYKPVGVSFSSVTAGSPAETAGLQTGVVYTLINNQSVSSLSDFAAAFGAVKPHENMTIGDSEEVVEVTVGESSANASAPYLGVGIYNRFTGDETVSFRAFSWLTRLFSLVAFLSLGIGLANLIPVGPLDGGKLVQLALHRASGEQKGNRHLVRISLFFLFIILLLLTPIFKATLKAVFG